MKQKPPSTGHNSAGRHSPQREAALKALLLKRSNPGYNIKGNVQDVINKAGAGSGGRGMNGNRAKNGGR